MGNTLTAVFEKVPEELGDPILAVLAVNKERITHA
jgi:hypothetical protein